MNMDITELILACQHQNENAQKKLFQLYHKRLYNYCTLLVKNIHDAQDVLSESFMRIFSELRRYKHCSTSAFEVWIYTITKNACFKHLEKNSKRTWQELDDEKDIPEDNAGPYMLGDHLYYCLWKIKYEHRVVVILKAIEEMPHKEISIYLRITEQDSRKYYYRARSELKKLINLNQL